MTEYGDRRWGWELTPQNIKDRKQLRKRVMKFKEMLRWHTKLIQIVDNGGLVRFIKNPNSQGNKFLNKLKDYLDNK